MPRRHVNDLELFYEEAGAGDPLVLVHGSWVGLATWELVRPGLAAAHRVVAYDRRGHTRSERPVPHGSRREQEDDLAGLIEALHCAPADVVANSFGGSIALGLAASRPELFHTLIVHEPPLVATIAEDPGLQSLTQQFMAKRQAVNERLEKGDIPGGTRLFVEEIAIGPGTWDLVPEEMRKTMIDNAPAYMEEQRDPGWASIDLQGLARFSAPVLLTHGDQSPPWFEQIAAQLAGAIEHAVREVFPGAGHLPHLTHAADYVSRVSAFIAASR